MSVPNPYELSEADARKLGYVDFDLKTLELKEELIVDDDDRSGESDFINVTRDVVNQLLDTDDKIAKVKSDFTFEALKKHFTNELVKYFLLIETRLLESHATYRTVTEASSNAKYDFASFGTRFWHFLVEGKLFSPTVLRKLSTLIYHYLTLHPREILLFREKIVKARLQFATNPPATIESDELDPIIDEALKPIDNSELYSSLKGLEEAGIAGQMDHFTKTVGMATARMELTKVLHKAIKSVFPELNPEFVQVGGFDRTNIDYHALYFQLSFGISGSKILDRSTLSLILTPVLRVMEKMGLYGDPTESLGSVVFRVCGDEEGNEWNEDGECDEEGDECDEEGNDCGEDGSEYDEEGNDCDEEDGECDDEDDCSGDEDELDKNANVKKDFPTRKLIISISSESSAFCKLANFYVQYDSRFAEMVLLLKYYLTKSNRFFCDASENESFLWLIIWFLQQSKLNNPPVLPTLDQLDLATKKSPDDLVDFCTDLASIPSSSNTQSLSDLVVEFIDWFRQFDFASFLNPCDGTFSKNYDKYLGHSGPPEESICILNPFSNSLKTILPFAKYVDECKRLFGMLKYKFLIEPENCVFLLTSVECFTGPDGPEFAYMKKPPMNPFKLKPEIAEKLEYPTDIRSLQVEPKSNPFASKFIASSFGQLELFQFSHDFFFVSKPLKQLVSCHNKNMPLYYKNVINYFRHLKSRLLKDHLTCEELIEGHFDDYAAYGERFWFWLIESKLFNVVFLRNYSILLYRYLQKYSNHENILNLRTQLRDVYLKIASRPEQEPKVAESDFVNFTPYDAKTLHGDIINNNNTDDQIDQLLTRVYLKNQSMKFADFIIEMIDSDEDLADLKLSLEQADGLAGGYNVFMKDFYFVVKFGDIKLDRTTFGMALQVIKKSVAVRYKLKSFSMEDGSFRFLLCSTREDSNESCKSVYFVSTDYDYYTGNSLLLLSEHDKRFVPVVLLLRYWICLHKFNRGAPFYATQFIFLVVHFLQQTSPPVLPPLKQLIESGPVKSIKQSPKKSSSSAELVVQFLKFCTQFDFVNQVISPLDGASYTKEDYCEMKDHEEFDEDSLSQIENPLSNKVSFLLEDSTEQFVEFVTKLLDEVKINSENCVKILTDPSISPSKRTTELTTD